MVRDQLPQQTCEIRAFQDGGPPHSQSSPKEGQFYGKDGPEGCFLHDSNSPPISTSPFQTEREGLPVQLSLFWLVQSTDSIHKDTQASHGDAEITQQSTGSLHGRYASNGRVQAEANRACPIDPISP